MAMVYPKICRKPSIGIRKLQHKNFLKHNAFSPLAIMTAWSYRRMSRKLLSFFEKLQHKDKKKLRIFSKVSANNITPNRSLDFVFRVLFALCRWIQPFSKA